MSKTVIITCDICEADITNSSKFELRRSDYFEDLNSILYFCGFEHLFKYLDDAKINNPNLII